VLKAVKNDFSPSELLSGTSEVLLLLGGDHGDGVFQMHLRMLVRLANELSLRYYATGDLKYYFQLVGRENMSTSWCFYCGLGPSEWDLSTEWHLEKEEFDETVHEECVRPWTVERICAAWVQKVNATRVLKPNRQRFKG